MKWQFIINWKDQSRSSWLGEAKGSEDFARTARAFLENLDGKAASVEIKINLCPVPVPA